RGFYEHRHRRQTVAEHDLHRIRRAQAAQHFLGAPEPLWRWNDPAGAIDVRLSVFAALDGPAFGRPGRLQARPIDSFSNLNIGEGDLFQHFAPVTHRLRPQQQARAPIDAQAVAIAQRVARLEDQDLTLDASDALQFACLQVVTFEHGFGRRTDQTRERILDRAVLDDHTARLRSQAPNLVIAVGSKADVFTRLAVQRLYPLVRVRTVEHVRDARSAHLSAGLIDDRSAVIDTHCGPLYRLDPLPRRALRRRSRFLNALLRSAGKARDCTAREEQCYKPAIDRRLGGRHMTSRLH